VEDKPDFSIVLDSKVIGGISGRVDVQNETGELGYSIGRSYWGQGLMPEASETVVDWAFEELVLAKVLAGADLRNIGSQRVMEKLGMTREGVLRSHGKSEVGNGLTTSITTSFARSGSNADDGET